MRVVMRATRTQQRVSWTTAVAIAALVWIARPTEAFDLDTAIDIIHIGREVVKSVFSAWKLVDETSDGGISVQAPSFLNRKERKLLGYIAQVGITTARLENQLGASTRAATRALHEFPRVLDIHTRVRDLERDCANLNDQYATLRRYIDNGYNNATDTWSLEPHTLEDLAINIVSHRYTSTRLIMARLDRQMARDGLPIRIAAAYMESETLHCTVQQSPQQVVYNLYNAVALAELKGYAMMQFSWMLLRLYNKGNFTQEASLLRTTFEDRTRRQVAATRAAMESAGRSVWRCDPPVHVENETYVRLTRLVQGHIQNEVDMNRDKTCRENCNYYSYAQTTGCYDQRTCDSMQRCNGRILDCQFIDSDMWVCQSDKFSPRRYEWLEYENGRTLGRPGTCERRRYKVDSWWRWLFWHCSYCFCLCDEPGPRSDRYFNLRPVPADVANDMIVTGLRFVKKNRVIHLQIQEGKLLPRGVVNASSIRWRPVDAYSISDPDVQSGRDFYTLSWEKRAIDLDDLEAPPGHVLTGVRFRAVGSHLNPEIMVTPFNFTAGTLIKPNEKSMWISNDNTDGAMLNPRTQLKLVAPDVPTISHEGSDPDSKTDQFILFTHSDIDADAAQTTVPYLDAQAVAPSPAVPLAGASIFHKGRRGYGGFIAPKVITYDYSRHLTAETPPPVAA